MRHEILVGEFHVLCCVVVLATHISVGTTYPRALVSNKPHPYGVEGVNNFTYNPTLNLIYRVESGNMLIMLWAHARSSGDGQYISQHVRFEVTLERDSC